MNLQQALWIQEAPELRVYSRFVTPEEWELYKELYEEFEGDEGNRHRIPLMIREED